LAHSGSFWLILGRFGSFLVHYGSFWLIPCFSTTNLIIKLVKIIFICYIVNLRVPDTVLKLKCSESLKCFSQMLEIHHENGRASLLMSV